MPSKSPEKVKEEILKVLDEVPRTVDEIAKLAGTSWPGAKKALEGLVRLGVVKTRKPGKRTMYYKPTGKTLFGLPIGEREKELLEYILWNAREIWKMTFKTEPGKTNLQKIAVEVDKRLSLDLPTFRYLYGEMSLLTTIPENPPKKVSMEGLYGAIEHAVKKYKGTARDAKNIQYSGEGMKFYRIKQEIVDNWEGLTSSGMLSKKLVELLLAAPDDEYIHESIKDFLGIYSMVQNKGRIEKFKYQLWSLFEGMWKEVALRLACLDLNRYGYSDNDLAELKRRYQEMTEENNLVIEEIENRLAYKIDPRIAALMRKG